MGIYFFLLFLSLMLLLLRKTLFYKKIIFRKSVFFIVMILLFVIYVFRDETVGTDYGLYNAFFNYTAEALKSFTIEPGYIYINNIAQNYNNFLILPSIIFLMLFIGMYLLSKELYIDDLLFLSFFILTYIYYDLFNVMRQFSALGIVCIGLYVFLKLYKHKYIKYIVYILIILLSTFFHNTAIACILLLFLFKFHLNKKLTIFFVLLIPILYIERITTNIASYILILFPNYASKYSNDLMYLTSNGNISNAQLFILIIESVFLLIYLYAAYYDQISNLKINFILNGYFIFLILATGSSNILIGRIQTYFYLFQFLFSCIFINKLSNNYLILKLIYVIFLIFVYLFQLMVIQNGGIIPYKFI